MKPITSVFIIPHLVKYSYHTELDLFFLVNVLKVEENILLIFSL